MKKSFSSAMLSPVVPMPPILPVGVRFNPTDEELIGYYLVMLLNGLYSNEMPIGIVSFLESEPWELPGLSRVKSDQVWYFFSQRLVYTDGEKKTFKRKTRAGRWSPTGESTVIEGLGKRSTLRFYKDLPKQKTEWIAYEYEITPNSILPNPGEFVIIKLMNSSGEKRTKMKTNTNKQNLRKKLTSVYDGSTSLDKVMTVSTDFGNQNEANTTVISMNSIQQQSIQEVAVSELMPTVSYGSYAVSSDYGHENPKEMAVTSTYDIGESSSRATSGCQNNSSVFAAQERTRVSPYILENQEDYILASDLDNQMLPSEIKDCLTKATRCTENQYENRKLPSVSEDSPSQATPYTEKRLTPDETNLSCSMTSRSEDHFENPNFNSSLCKDSDFCSLVDLDADMNFHELVNYLNQTIQPTTCLDQCM